MPSQANFIFTRPPRFPAGDWLEKLRAEKILVRWWSNPEVRDFLRITIGTPKEMETFLKTVRRLLKPSAQNAKRLLRK
jgi:histidinol-phosphate aminotransferase